VRSAHTDLLPFYGSKPMSTIDIGIAEAPARATAHPSIRTLTPTVAPDAIHVDFYVGSTKIDALPLATTTPSAATGLPTA
jgi:hypothetical protein